jgi:hypothetical protein
MMRVEPRLRPRTFGGLLDAAFESLRYDLAPLVGISLVVNAPLAAAVLLLLFGVTLLGASFAPAVLPLAAVAAALFMLRPLAQAAVTAALEERTESGRAPSIRGAYARAAKAGLAVVFADAASFALAAIAGILYVVPGLIVSGWLALAVPAAVLERTGPFESLARSTELLKGRVTRGIEAVVFVLVAAAILALDAHGGITAGLAAARLFLGVDTAYWEAFLSAGNSLYVVALLLLVYLAVEPYRACLFYHLHLDGRVRYEAVDLLRELDRVAAETRDRERASAAPAEAAS